MMWRQRCKYSRESTFQLSHVIVGATRITSEIAVKTFWRPCEWFSERDIYSFLRGLFILIPDLRLVSLHGNSSQQILVISTEQIFEAHFHGGCFLTVDVSYGKISEATRGRNSAVLSFSRLRHNLFSS